MKPTNKEDYLGDRLKGYEQRYNITIFPSEICIARMDGRGFHNFTKGLERPFCKPLRDLMSKVTKKLCEETNADIGYTQSDEISLVFLPKTGDSQHYFGGRINKLTSILAGTTTALFNKYMMDLLPTKWQDYIAFGDRIPPVFDARVFTVPNIDEAVNYLIWRENDATRNSIAMVAQSKFSHSELQGKDCDEMQKMLFQKFEINWNDFESKYKRGTYIKKWIKKRKFTFDEIEKLPVLHEARKNPDLEIVRSEYIQTGFEVLNRIPFGERKEVLFGQ